MTPFDRRDFTDPTRIDNRFLPFVPGTQFILEGSAATSGGAVTRRIVLTVTDLTKVINGVRSAVLLDVDINDGQLAEAELAFQAQDSAGRVWDQGEYPEEYENGKFVGAPSTWISGVAGAEAGQHMLAHLAVGGRTYLQGFAPRIDFLDCAKVFKEHQRICVSGTCYNDVLEIEESSPLDPDNARQHKFYAPGVGNIKITPVNDPEAETLDLVRVNHLGAPALGAVRTAACLLETRAYKVSAVYRTTPHMQCG
ncbi:MAG: hypothetical protein AUG44_05745 [Actinobacteria bacterium 13_1_20CM_3_71_11]|nr:MAG: hypothetical protein AUG44_05745 [Actinobacteria bacterium 13_1_20CM_3_71_11]